MKARRNRTANYTNEEAEFLIDLVSELKHVIECKKVDAVTWRKKAAAWEQVAQKFNSFSLVCRSGEQLRHKYEVLKKEAKQESSREKHVMMRPGGGPMRPSGNETLRTVYEKIRSIIQLSVDGMVPSVDSDSVMSHSDVDEPDEVHEPNENEIKYADRPDIADWGHYSRKMLRQPNHTALQTSGSSPSQNLVISANVCSSSSSTAVNGRVSAPTINQNIPSTSTAAAAATGWTSRWKPSLSVKQQVALSANTDNFSKMAEAKKDLAVLRKNLLESENEDIRRQREELHQLDLQIKKSQLELLQLDIKLKKKQLGLPTV